MDAEFEKYWFHEDSNLDVDYEIARAAWNASKQHWLDKCVEVAVNEKLKGNSMMLQKNHISACDSIEKAIKELKK